MDQVLPTGVEKELRHLAGWRVEENVLKKDYEFSDFSEAMDFVNRLASVADKLNHHPDWSNSYNKVSLSLTTHSAGSLTEKDFILARAADEAAKVIAQR